jgi:hypothetical protein
MMGRLFNIYERHQEIPGAQIEHVTSHYNSELPDFNSETSLLSELFRLLET